jgi:hypothetical protein
MCALGLPPAAVPDPARIDQARRGLARAVVQPGIVTEAVRAFAFHGEDVAVARERRGARDAARRVGLGARGVVPLGDRAVARPSRRGWWRRRRRRNRGLGRDDRSVGFVGRNATAARGDRDERETFKETSERA